MSIVSSDPVHPQAIALEPQDPLSDLNRREVQAPQTKLQTSDSADIALLKQIGAAEEFETVKSILDQRWTLANVLQEIGSRTDRAVEFIRGLHSFDAGIWRRSLAAYIASEIHIPPEDIIRLGFNTDLHWGSVTALCASDAFAFHASIEAGGCSGCSARGGKRPSIQ